MYALFLRYSVHDIVIGYISSINKSGIKNTNRKCCPRRRLTAESIEANVGG